MGLASGAVGAGTMAYFSDSESSTGNSIEAGSLQLGFDGQETFNFSTSLAPTKSTGDTITLVNGGSVSGSLDIDVSYSGNDSVSNDSTISPDDVAENILVRTLEYRGTDIRDQQNLPEEPTLLDLANNEQAHGEEINNDIVDLADPGAGSALDVELELADVGDEFQGMGLDITFEFYMNQTDGQ